MVCITGCGPSHRLYATRAEERPLTPRVSLWKPILAMMGGFMSSSRGSMLLRTSSHTIGSRVGHTWGGGGEGCGCGCVWWWGGR
jgi:hypothetical protein